MVGSVRQATTNRIRFRSTGGVRNEALSFTPQDVSTANRWRLGKAVDNGPIRALLEANSGPIRTEPARNSRGDREAAFGHDQRSLGAPGDLLRDRTEDELLEQPFPGGPDDREVVVRRTLHDGLDDVLTVEQRRFDPVVVAETTVGVSSSRFSASRSLE